MSDNNDLQIPAELVISYWKNEAKAQAERANNAELLALAWQEKVRDLTSQPNPEQSDDE